MLLHRIQAHDVVFNPGARLDLDRDIEQIGRVRLHQGEADSPVATLDIA